ncbi:MAG TPA: hypothetical protein PLX35_10280 [Cyclobacteriaceae bacterium]|nr:hypothetical protein [Cyclobacteriaceae bacterium]
MNIKEFQIGDYVRHKNHSVNGGLKMSIEDMRVNTKGEGEGEYQLSHFGTPSALMKTEWFNENNLELIEESDGGFKQ